MPFEIEAKLKVDSHDAVRQRLQESGARLREETIETDRLFDRIEQNLREQGIALRLRTVQRADNRSTIRSVLTVKGPATTGAVKTREEVEQPVQDADAAARMLELLGFSADLTYQKRRETWEHRECIISLDTPPHIGYFVEIEGPTEERVLEVQAELGLENLPHVRPSYAAMLAAFCEGNNLTDRKVMLE